MERVYKVNYRKAPGTYATISLILLPFVATLLILLSRTPFSEAIKILIFVFPMSFLWVFIGIYFLNVKITIKDDGIYVKKMDKLEVAKWEEIRKVERLLAFGAYRFIVRKKKGFIEFWDYIEGYEEILAEIKKRTGLEVKWGI